MIKLIAFFFVLIMPINTMAISQCVLGNGVCVDNGVAGQSICNRDGVDYSNVSCDPSSGIYYGVQMQACVYQSDGITPQCSDAGACVITSNWIIEATELCTTPPTTNPPTGSVCQVFGGNCTLGSGSGSATYYCHAPDGQSVPLSCANGSGSNNGNQYPMCDGTTCNAAQGCINPETGNVTVLPICQDPNADVLAELKLHTSQLDNLLTSSNDAKNSLYDIQINLNNVSTYDSELGSSSLVTSDNSTHVKLDSLHSDIGATNSTLANILDALNGYPGSPGGSGSSSDTLTHDKLDSLNTAVGSSNSTLSNILDSINGLSESLGNNVVGDVENDDFMSSVNAAKSTEATEDGKLRSAATGELDPIEGFDITNILPLPDSGVCEALPQQTFHVPFIGYKVFNFDPCEKLAPLRQILYFAFLIITMISSFKIMTRGTS